MERGESQPNVKHGRIIRAFAALGASGLVAACVPSEASPESTPEPWSGTTPTVPYEQQSDQPMSTDSIPPPTVCTYDGEVLLTGDHSSDLIDTSTPRQDAGTALVDLINAKHPYLLPSQFTQTYIDGLQLLMGEDVGVDIIVDPSLDLKEWPADHETETATTYDLGNGESLTEKDLAQDRLAWALQDLVEQVSRYPRELYEKLGVEQIRLASIHDYYMGHFDSYNKEIEYDFELEMTSDSTMYNLLAHELAHAYHYAYCGGAEWNDPELSGFNSVPYQGYAPDTEYSEGTTATQDTVSEALYTYGPTREFVEPYSLSSPQEDFATLVEWTLSQRGLIQEQDADFNSPLYKKQQLVVDRLEQLMPGARAYIESQTVMLRFDSNNEIFDAENIPTVDMNFNDLYALVEEQKNEPLLLNAVFSKDFFSESVPYPSLVSFSALGTESYEESDYVTVFMEPFEDGTFQRMYISSNYPKDLTLFVPESSVVDGKYIDQLFTPQSAVLNDQRYLTPNGKIDIDQIQRYPEFTNYIKDLRFVPITLRITSQG